MSNPCNFSNSRRPISVCHRHLTLLAQPCHPCVASFSQPRHSISDKHRSPSEQHVPIQEQSPPYLCWPQSSHPCVTAISPSRSDGHVHTRAIRTIPVTVAAPFLLVTTISPLCHSRLTLEVRWARPSHLQSTHVTHLTPNYGETLLYIV